MSEFENNENVQPDEIEVEELVVKKEPAVKKEPERAFRHDTPLDVEVVRVHHRDDFDQTIVDEEAESEDYDDNADDGGAEADGGENTRRERFKLMRQIVLGTILSNDSVRENYRYVITIAIMLFTSIVMLFSSLGSYLRYTQLADEVHLLRERAIRMSEQRYESSSHSAIVRRLEERGIKLVDPQEPHEILD